MSKKLLPHFIAVGAFVMFIVLGLACASGPNIGPGEASMVYFDANGGSGTVPIVGDNGLIEKGASITIPSGEGLSYPFGDAIFLGWDCYEGSSSNIVANFKGGELFTPTGGSFRLIAKWEVGDVDFESVTGLENKLLWLRTKAENGVSYTIELNTNERIRQLNFICPGKSNITVTLIGIGANRIISSSSGTFSSSFLRVGNGVTLVLDNNITLQSSNKDEKGYANRYSIVLVEGTLRMNAGSTLSENGGAGVEVKEGGTFILNGGNISNNSGGVIVGGTFTLDSGNISNNRQIGVEVVKTKNATFTMNGGIIARNSMNGVRMYGGTFTMNNGTISNNGTLTEDGNGGGVHLDILGDSPTFIMNGGTISENSVGWNGGGVYVGAGTLALKAGRAVINGGTISGNRAGRGGNGVFGPVEIKGGNVQRD